MKKIKIESEEVVVKGTARVIVCNTKLGIRLARVDAACDQVAERMVYNDEYNQMIISEIRSFIDELIAISTNTEQVKRDKRGNVIEDEKQV